MQIEKYKEKYIANFEDMKDYVDSDTCLVLENEHKDSNILWHGNMDECKKFIDDILPSIPKNENELENFCESIVEEIKIYRKDSIDFSKKLMEVKDDLNEVSKIVSKNVKMSNDISKKIFYTAIRFDNFFDAWKYTSVRKTTNKGNIKTGVSVNIYKIKKSLHPCEIVLPYDDNGEFFTIDTHDFNFSELPDNRLFQFFENNYNNLTFFAFEKDGHDRQYKIEEIDLNIIKKEIKDIYIESDIIKSNIINNIAKRAGTRQGFPSTPRKTYIYNFEKAFSNDKYNISDVKEYMKNSNFYNIECMKKLVYYKNWKIYVNDAILEIEGKIPEENLEKSKKENIFTRFFNKNNFK